MMHGTMSLVSAPSLRFDPFAEIARMTQHKDTILKTLAEERAQRRPNEAVIASCEIWLRVYNEATQRLAAYVAPRTGTNS